MKKFAFSAFLAVFLSGAFFAPAAWADSTAEAATPRKVASLAPGNEPSKVSVLNKVMAEKQAELLKSARAWISKANRHLLPSRHKPRIVKNSDGTYKAVYFVRREYLDNEINPGTRALYEVTKEKFGYSGTFRFVEVIYESYGRTPEECIKGEYTPKLRRPNAQIFSYSQGSWQ